MSKLIVKRDSNYVTLTWLGDMNKNLSSITKTIEVIIPHQSIITASCFGEGSLQQDLLREIECKKLKQTILERSNGELTFEVEGKYMLDIINLIEKNDITLGFKGNDLGISGAINDNDGTFIKIPQLYFDKNENAVINASAKIYNEM